MIAPKWNRIGYVEGQLRITENTQLTIRSILYVRQPFLWFRTRKVKEIGDRKYCNGITSESLRTHDLLIQDWLAGGTIEYISDSSYYTNPAKVIKLVKE